MPNRMVRDDLLKSERYWSCSPEARNLYLSILLSADDTARCQGSTWYLRTHCMAGTITNERCDKLLQELQDCDLVRIYEKNGARYLHVPRYKQRLRYVNSKYPEPPKEINDLLITKSDLGRTQDRPEADSSLLEVKRSEEKLNKGARGDISTRQKQLQTLLNKTLGSEALQNPDIERNREIARKLATGETSLTKS